MMGSPPLHRSGLDVAANDHAATHSGSAFGCPQCVPLTLSPLSTTSSLLVADADATQSHTAAAAAAAASLPHSAHAPQPHTASLPGTTPMPRSIAAHLTVRLPQTFAACNPAFAYTLASNPKRVLTKPSKPVLNEGWDNQDNDYILYVNDVLGNKDDQQYHILDLLGQGTFGQVVKCQNIKTKDFVAVKVIKNKPAYYNQSLVEVAILDILNNKWDQTDKYHIVGMKDTFVFRNHLCIVFEMLSANLYELIKQNQFRGLSTNLVRVFVKQILECLVLLGRAKIIHSDLKPENILLKTLSEPEIKVIDFGSACHENQTIYTYIQSRFYRSPEVLVGLPYTSSIDMWSLGCIAAELFLGLPLFPGTSEYNQVSRIVGVLGMPQQWMCEKGKNSKNFFVKRQRVDGVRYELKSMEAYMRDTGLSEQASKRYFAGNTLEEIINAYPMPKKEMNPLELEKEMNNRRCLLDFLGGLLKLNPLERWSPQQAKMHPFVTGEPYLAPFATSAAFRLQPTVFQSPPPHESMSSTYVHKGSPPAPPSLSSHSVSPAESLKMSNTTSPVATPSNTTPPTTTTATRRPRANTMIQAVPPQLQKIVSMQQQSGPNKMSLRNAAAGTIVPGNAGSPGHVSDAVARASLNNDDVVYSSPDMKPTQAASRGGASAEHLVLDSGGDAAAAAGGRPRSSQQQQQQQLLDAKHASLRRAASDTVYQNQSVPPPTLQFPHHHHGPPHPHLSPNPPLPPQHAFVNGGAESVGSLGAYETHHYPHEVLLANMSLTAPTEVASQQQHPRMGEKGERISASGKAAFVSRAPSLPGLSELDPIGGSAAAKTTYHHHHQMEAPRNHSSADLGAPMYDLGQRRLSLTGEGGFGSPRFRSQQGGGGGGGGSMSLYGGGMSSPRNSFAASPRNSYQPQQHSPYNQHPVAGQHSPYNQHPVAAQHSPYNQHPVAAQHSPYNQQPVPPVSYQYPPQNGLGVAYDGGSAYGAAVGGDSPNAAAIARGRSYSVSMYGAFPLNQPWNQPVPQSQQHQPSQYQQQQQQQPTPSQQNQHQPRAGKKRPPNISTALATNPQHFQQGGGAYPFSAASLPSSSASGAGVYGFPIPPPPAALVNGYPPLSANDVSASARNADNMIGIPPQRINHPVTLGMRRQSVQYGTTPPVYSSSFHSPGVGGGLRPSSYMGGAAGVGGYNSPVVGGGGGGGGGAGMEFPKSNLVDAVISGESEIPIPAVVASSLAAAAAGGSRALRFSSLPNVVPLDLGERRGVGGGGGEEEKE
ncbi:dual specificity protein kinase yak1 [Podochytrium sp. JEL0797]|nr:dual specificity protein kinase yak1 [Podochytrium sp. JEL0797]